MPGFDLQQRQSQIQSQVQVLSQKQIQSLGLLSLGSDDLRTEIYKAVEDNPALMITRDPVAQGADVSRVSKGPVDYTRVVSSTSAAAREASDDFQAALEATADERQSLKEHLLSQYHLFHLTKAELALGEKLIDNLSDKGFHILAPVSLLDRSDPEQTDELLARCLDLIQHLDPVGTCTTGTEESLYVQAQAKQNAPELALFILDGHFSFLNPPQSTRIVKKIKDYLAEQSKLFGLTPKQIAYQKLTVTEETVDQALSFIKTLDPFPARDFGTTATTYIAPDVYVERIPEHTDHDDLDRGVITDGTNTWIIRLANNTMPQVTISPEFIALTQKKAVTADDKKLVEGSIKKAQDFLDTLAFRENTVARACCLIVKRQHDFFANGAGHLVPLRQQDIADALGVHETTISRMANSKFIQCEWGLFDIKYFFTGAAVKNMSFTENDDSGSAVSKDSVQFEMKKLLEAHKDDAKKLSDQKLADLLAEHGFVIARRTVAKYRSQLNIESSFNR